MKHLLILLAVLAIAGLLVIFVGVRLLGPKLISVDPPSGTPIGERDLPRPEASLLAVNIAVPVSLLNEVANAEVPDRFAGSEMKDFHKTIKEGAYAWEVTRDRIQFQNTGTQLVFSVPFHGTARAKGALDARILTIPLAGSADLGGTAGGALAPLVTPDWGIQPNLVPSLDLKKATLGLGQLGSIDVGELLGSDFGKYLQREIQKFAPALTRSLNLRREVTKLWDQAHLIEMVSDDPPIWVRVTPQQLLLTPIDFSQSDRISLTVAVRSATYLTNREPAAATPAPLPEMIPLEGPTATNLHLPLVLSIGELNKVLGAESLEIDTGIGTKVKLSGLQAEVGQNGLLNLQLYLEADQSRLGRGVVGSIWVAGRPVINYEDQTLGFTEVELTVETRDKLTGVAAWLLQGILVKGIEAELRIDLNDYQAELDEEVQKAIAQADLPDGLDVSLKNLDVKLTDIYTITRHSADGEPDPGIVIVIRATGDVGTSVNQLILQAEPNP